VDTNLTIEVPDELARTLATIAAAEHKTIQQLAIERLRTLAGAAPEEAVGSPAAVLRAMNQPPHLNPSDVDDLDSAIAAARLPIQSRNLF